MACYTWYPVHLGHQQLLKFPEWTSETFLQRILNREQYESSLDMNFYVLYCLKICPNFKHFQESPLPVQSLVNHGECDLSSLAPCVCCSLLLLILWLVLHGSICFEGTQAGTSGMTLPSEPWHKNQSSTAVPYAAERTQCKTRHISVTRWATEEKRAAGEQKKTWHLNWAWGYKWTLSETFSSLGLVFFNIFKDRKPAGDSLIPAYLKCSSQHLVTLPWIPDELIRLMLSQWIANEPITIAHFQSSISL